MKKLSYLLLRCALIGAAAMLLQPGANAQDNNSSSLAVPEDELPISPITVGDVNHKVHILPPPSANTFAATDTGPLLYHAGGTRAVVHRPVADDDIVLRRGRAARHERDEDRKTHD